MGNEVMTHHYPAIEIQETQNMGSFSLFFGFIRRFFWLILIFTLLGLGIGTGLAYKKDQTVYTQTKSVILLARIEGSTQTTNLSLTKKYMPTVQGVITKQTFINVANEIYKGKGGSGYIYAGSIGVQAGNGMILNISYTDADPNVAAAKLDAFLVAAKDVIQNGGLSEGEALITADGVDFKPIDNVPITTSSNGFIKFILLGVLGGLVIGVALAFIIYLLDNAVRNREDLERLTGSTVIAYIDDVDKLRK